jgi:hypothetical protein
VSQIRRIGRYAVLAITAATLSACGFVGASDKSSEKPNGFVLFGHAAVTLPTNDHRATGTPCTSSVAGVSAGTAVRVTDPTGKVLGMTYLGDGVIGHDNNTPTCNFPFSINAVPGGVDSYGIVIGSRPTQQFAATTLRQNNAAVISITG